MNVVLLQSEGFYEVYEYFCLKMHITIIAQLTSIKCRQQTYTNKLEMPILQCVHTL